MSSAASEETTVRQPRARLGFAAATLSLLAVYASAGAPIPLYEQYRIQGGLTTTDLSIATVFYMVSVAGSLIVLGRLSNHLGRRTVGLTAVILAVLSFLPLLEVNSLASLTAGRVLQGLASGLASSALTSYVIDLAPKRPRWLAPTIVTSAPMLGITIGAVTTGTIAEFGPAPLQTPYFVFTAVLIVGFVLLLFSPETMQRKRGVLKSLRPHVSMPRAIRPLLPATIAALVSTWGLGGFYLAFSPTISAESLGTTSTLVAAAVFASYMAPNIIGGPLTGNLAPVTAQRLGMTVFALMTFGIVAGFFIGNILLVVLCGIVASFSQGIALAGSMRGMVKRITLEERAGVMSTVYLFSYGGAAVPSFIVGLLTIHLDLVNITVGYLGLALIAVTVVWLSTRSVQKNAFSHSTVD